MKPRPKPVHGHLVQSPNDAYKGTGEEKGSMEKTIELKINPENKIAMVLAEPSIPSGKIVLLCHGFMSSKESSTNLLLTEKLLAENIATCRFDFYGHGADGHPFQEMTLGHCLNQAEEVISWIAQSDYSKVGLIGSSYGGLVAILLAARHPEILVLGLKCPVSDYPPLWQALLGQAGMAAWEKDGILNFASPEGRARLNYAFFEDLLSADAYKAAAAIRSPTLIVHGDADEDVPVEQSERLYRTLETKKKFEKMAGADHPFTKEEDFELMIDRLLRWFVAAFKKE